MSYSKSHILIVDEEKTVDDLKAALAEAGYTCHHAFSGNAAKEVLGSRTVDLTLMGIKVPDMTGASLFRHVKEVYPAMPVILVTGIGDVRLMAEQFESGMTDFLVKPVPRKRLLRAVESALERRKAAAQAAGHLAHLEELVVIQARALQNTLREVTALNRMMQSELFWELAQDSTSRTSAFTSPPDGSPVPA